jgi:hypothetical protein
VNEGCERGRGCRERGTNSPSPPLSLLPTLSHPPAPGHALSPTHLHQHALPLLFLLYFIFNVIIIRLLLILFLNYYNWLHTRRLPVTGTGTNIPRVQKWLPAIVTRTRITGTGYCRVRVRVRQKIPGGYPCRSLDLTCLDAHLYFRSPVEQLTGAAVNKLQAYRLSEEQWDLAETLSAILEVIILVFHKQITDFNFVTDF